MSRQGLAHLKIDSPRIADRKPIFLQTPSNVGLAGSVYELQES